jgi:hypothetical protein
MNTEVFIGCLQFTHGFTATEHPKHATARAGQAAWNGKCVRTEALQKLLYPVHKLSDRRPTKKQGKYGGYMRV